MSESELVREFQQGMFIWEVTIHEARANHSNMPTSTNLYLVKKNKQQNKTKKTQSDRRVPYFQPGYISTVL